MPKRRKPIQLKAWANVRMKKKQPKARLRTTRGWSRAKKQLLTGLIIAFAFGGVGSYYLLVSHANGSYTAGVALYDWNPHIPAQVGQTYTFHWHVFVSSFGNLDTELPFTAKWTAGPGSNAINVSPTSGQFTVDSSFATNHSNEKDLYIQVTSTSDCSVTESVTLTVYGKSGAQIASASQDSGPSGYGCPPAPTPDPSPNPGPPPAPSPNPGDSPSPGPGPGDSPTRGSGGGGSGGGSSATTQSNEPSQTPTSSPQGTKTQPQIPQPSPFYDGKEYAPGSDPLDKTLGNISLAGKTIAHGWFYLLLLICAVAGLSGYYLWRQRPHLFHKPHRR